MIDPELYGKLWGKEAMVTQSENLHWRTAKLRRLSGESMHVDIAESSIKWKAHPAFVLLIRVVNEKTAFLRQLNEDLQTHVSGMLVIIELARLKSQVEALDPTIEEELSRQVRERLLSIPDLSMVARWKEDQFVVYAPHVGAEEERRSECLDQIHQVFFHMFELGGRSIYMTVNLGGSLLPDHGKEAEELLAKADMAMHVSRRKERSFCQLYSKELEATLERRSMILSQLPRAIELQEIVLNYQPIFDVRSHSLTGVEALARWKHPELGTIAPDEFIPIAEDTGLIVMLGNLVLLTACKQAQAWNARKHELIVSVNVSAQHFLKSDFVMSLQYALQESGLPASLLNIEITESLPMLDFEGAVRKMHQIKSMGVTISLDDFGTGYSSLSYLSELPFDYVKMDQSFVKKASTSPYHLITLQSIISIAHSLDRKIVAEGVETEEALQLLVEHGCDEAQGYLFHPPLSPEALDTLLEYVEG